jgi:hypothetical protein
MPNPALPAVIDHIRRLTRPPAGQGLTDRPIGLVVWLRVGNPRGSASRG